MPRALAPMRLTLAAAALLGCAADDSEPTPAPPSCADPLELMLPDESCIRPGIAPDGCAPGFVHDGSWGCEPVLPPEPCPPGLMAVPGETACRPVMPCGAGRWGDIPVDASTEHVDGAYAGAGSDGSEARPWTTIGEAVSAAAPGAIVAVARGSYAEDVLISGKPVRLWGVCPDEVAIVATGQPSAPCPPAAVCIVSGADGAEVRGLALTGAGLGVTMSGAEEVLLEKIRVHDAADRGIDAEALLGATSLTVRASLVEDNRELGLYVSGSHALVEASVVRATLPRASDQAGGRGITIQVPCAPTPMGQVCDPASRASATVRGSLVEDNRDIGLFISGADAVVEATVVRATLPQASDQAGGRGISIQLPCAQTPMGLVCDPAARSSATVRGSLVEDNHELGLFVAGSDAVVEATVVRATLPRASDRAVGRGIHIQLSCAPTPMGQVCDPASRASATVRGSLVEDNRDIGLYVGGSDAVVEASVVRATSARASDGLFGDGVVVASEDAPAAATVSATRIEESARAGLASFGAFVSLASTRIQCAAFPLAGEPHEGQSFVFDDGGDNLCGCPTADGACKAIGVGLEPPEPVGGVE